MDYIRKLFCLSVENNFAFSSIYIYISTYDDHLCDALSRLSEPGTVVRIQAIETSGICVASTGFCLPKSGEVEDGAAGLSGKILCT